AGRGSLTVTPVAVSMPAALLLLTVMVKVTLLPTLGVALFTVLVKDRSICWPSTPTLAWSSSPALLLLGVESTSGWVALATCAVLVRATALLTVAVMVRVALAPGARPLARVQMPVPLLYEPLALPSRRTSDLAGRGSLTVTPVAVSIPAALLLLTV